MPVGLAGRVLADDGQAEGGQVLFDFHRVDRARETHVHRHVASGVHFRAKGAAADPRHERGTAFGGGAVRGLVAVPLNERTQPAPEVRWDDGVVGAGVQRRHQAQQHEREPAKDRARNW